MDNRCKFRWSALVFVWVLAGWVYSDAESDFDLKPLRDPFWPVGYFPDAWQEDPSSQGVMPTESNRNWAAAEGLIQVRATSRMGDRTAAIINDQIKEEGDVIEIIHNNQIYKWKVRDVNLNGTVSLDRLEVTNRKIGFQSGDKK